MKKKFEVGDVVYIKDKSKFGPCEVLNCSRDLDGVWFYEIYPTEFNPPFAITLAQSKLRICAAKE